MIVEGKENELKGNGKSNFSTNMGSYRSKKRDIEDSGNDEKWEIKLTISQLEETLPSMGWRTLLKEVLHPSIRLEDHDEIYALSSEHLLKLRTLMKPDMKRSLANYMMWHAVFKMADYLSADIGTGLFDGGRTRDDKWKTCVWESKTRGLSLALASLLARKHIKDNPTVERALSLAKDIQKQLIMDLDKEDWVDRQTRRRAKKKISSVKLHIGFPTQLLNNTKLDRHYEKLVMRTTDFISASRDLMKWEVYNFVKSRKRPKKFDWRYDTTYLFSSNAKYDHRNNVLEIPGPQLIFQNTFNSKVPLYIAYGHVGTTAGHKLIHPIGEKGLDYNAYGNPKSWVSDRSMVNYTIRERCMMNQYSSYKEPITQLYVDGHTTLDENISDNSGLKVTYHAYRRAAKKQGTEPGLPHLGHYTPDQLFFITAANRYCEIPDQELLMGMIFNGDHPPNNVRVNGMMMNSRAFSKAFNCVKDDKMNPAKKCKLW